MIPVVPDTWYRCGYCWCFSFSFLFLYGKKEGIQVVIVSGFHLYPFRTEKLNLTAPMVLRHSGRVGSCRIIGEDGGWKTAGSCSPPYFFPLGDAFFPPSPATRFPDTPLPFFSGIQKKVYIISILFLITSYIFRNK